MINKYLIPALVILILAGCYKEQEPIQEPATEPQKEQQETAFTFSSSMGDVTKVTLNPDNSLFWASGDKIAVYDYKAGSVYAKDIAVLTGGERTAVGTFTPDVKTTNTDWYNAADASDQVYNFYAFYPGGTEAVNPTDGKVTVSVAASQQESVGIGKYIVSWASANTTKQNLAGGSAPNFAFAPKSALLKLTLRNSADIPVKITSIQISAASVNIAGDASLSLGTGVLSAGSGKVITYIPSSPIEIASGAVASAPVYVSMLPCAPGSLTVTLNQAGFAYTVADINLATIESGHVYSKEAAISSVSRELAISNDNTTNLADAAAMDSDPNLYYGTSNCVVMDANDIQCFIAIGLYKSDDGYTRSSSNAGKNTAVKKAKVIWAEKGLNEDPNFCIASGTRGMLTVTKSAGVTGNALIGIYDESDGLLWSYHVWCPFDKSTLSVTSEGTSTKFSAFKLALGQITGADSDTYMYYQWGRKDPLGRANPGFIGNSLLTVYGESIPSTGNTIAATATGATGNNLSYARKNPTKYITRNDEKLYDWYPVAAAAAARTDANKPNGQNDNLWVTTKATIFDPCPSGYRVAPKTLWDGSKGKEAGPLFDSAGLWYVLGGSRDRSDGGVNFVASGGYSWSSEAVGGANRNSYYLDFGSGTSLGRAYGFSRAGGFGVRCVKDDATSGSKRELAISNGNVSNLANSSALDAAYADDATDPSSLYYGSANCVVMGASDTRALIDIRLMKSSDGYSRSGADASPKVTAVKKAKVIWAESDLYYDPAFAIPEGNTNQIIVTKSAGVTGNALVGIYDESNKLLWSYHIWCPADRSIVSATSEDASPVTFLAYKLALGQIHGADCDTYMYYQWGRKDPLGRAVSSFDNNLIQMHGDTYPTSGGTSATATESTTDNRSYARKNPTIFIKQNDTKLYDWYPATSGTARTSDSNTGGQNDNLWKSDRATIFDPCPQGYHVAPRELWAGSAEKAEGPLFSTAGLWYVLGGNRSGNEGAVGSLLVYGRYWSSEVQGGSMVDALVLSFRPASGQVGRNGNVRRSDGQGVRCVKY